MPVLLFKSDLDPPGPWIETLGALMPTLDVRVWPQLGEPTDIEYALVWKSPGQALLKLPNLKLIFSLGAGVDHLLNENGLPTRVPLVRIADPALTEGMSEYVLYHVLRYHRRMAQYERQQRERCWQPLPQVRPSQRRIGIMGLGVLGEDAGHKLAALGFAVAGWSRSRKTIAGVESFHGHTQLRPFLNRTEILVCLLPLTRQTEAIIDRHALAALPPGAFVINVARGGHLVENDLLAALDSGHIAAATLDVCRTEPLPDDHPFWRHPKVTLTPHIASLTNPYTAAAHVVANIRRFERGEPLVGVVDRERGY